MPINEPLVPEHSLAKSMPKRGGGFRRFMRVFLLIIIIGIGLFIYWKFYYPYTDDGVKSGYLNYAVRKGQLFKTYEGKLIQEGIRSRTTGSIQSNEFEFSIKSKRIFDVLRGKYRRMLSRQLRDFRFGDACMDPTWQVLK